LSRGGRKGFGRNTMRSWFSETPSTRSLSLLRRWHSFPKTRF
jgi:hypothetical protein